MKKGIFTVIILMTGLPLAAFADGSLEPTATYIGDNNEEITKKKK